MLQAFGYEPTSQTLAVRFGPSRTYHYHDVPAEVYAKLCDAESIGTSFAKLIRGQYRHTVILEENAESLETAE
jgi:hypothetical protein